MVFRHRVEIRSAERPRIHVRHTPRAFTAGLDTDVRVDVSRKGRNIQLVHALPEKGSRVPEIFRHEGRRPAHVSEELRRPDLPADLLRIPEDRRRGGHDLQACVAGREDPCLHRLPAGTHISPDRILPRERHVQPDPVRTQLLYQIPPLHRGIGVHNAPDFGLRRDFHGRYLLICFGIWFLHFHYNTWRFHLQSSGENRIYANSAEVNGHRYGINVPLIPQQRIDH